jgi:hypothetical protein
MCAASTSCASRICRRRPGGIRGGSAVMGSGYRQDGPASTGKPPTTDGGTPQAECGPVVSPVSPVSPCFSDLGRLGDTAGTTGGRGPPHPRDVPAPGRMPGRTGPKRPGSIRANRAVGGGERRGVTGNNRRGPGRPSPQIARRTGPLLQNWLRGFASRRPVRRYSGGLMAVASVLPPWQDAVREPRPQ